MIQVFTFKNVHYKNILKIADLTLPPLQTTCIVGESGSGKTTLLKLLNNLLTPEGGEVLYKGANMATLDPVQLRREVVMLPQTPLIFPGTIKENLLLGLQFAEKPVVGDDVLLSMLNRLYLHKELKDDASVLSGGEKQRLAICRIMLMKPEVFLLDEPTSALDDSTEDMAMEVLVSFAGEHQKTLVLITHSREVARKYGDVIVTLKGGEMAKVEDGGGI